MKEDDKPLLAILLRTIEQLCFQNLALEALADKFAPQDWKTLVDKLASDERLHPEVRERFRQIYAELGNEQSPSQSVLENFLRQVVVRGKPN